MISGVLSSLGIDAGYLIIIPGLAVVLTVICFNILGDKLRDILDPSLKD